MEGKTYRTRHFSAISCLVVVSVLLLGWLQSCHAQCDTPCEGLGNYALSHEPLPKDCKDIQDRGITKSGVYTVFPQDVYLCVSFRVYCDMDTDGGGWTVFQRRYNNRLDFYLRWLDYRLGFGSLGSEFWLGNEHLNHLTGQDDYLLRVDLEAFDGEKASATYADFRVGSESDNYRLYLGNFTGGKAGDSLSSHRGSSFSTSDSDLSGGRCSSFRRGAWWYPRLCGDSNLNARYYEAGVNTEFGEGIMWRSWRGLTYSLRGTELKFRPMVEGDRTRPEPQETGGGAEEENIMEEEEEEAAEEEESSSISSSSAEFEEEPENEPTEAAPIDEPPRGKVKGSIVPRKGKKNKNKTDKQN